MKIYYKCTYLFSILQPEILKCLVNIVIILTLYVLPTILNSSIVQIFCPPNPGFDWFVRSCHKIIHNNTIINYNICYNIHIIYSLIGAEVRGIQLIDITTNHPFIITYIVIIFILQYYYLSEHYCFVEGMYNLIFSNNCAKINVINS